MEAGWCNGRAKKTHLLTRSICLRQRELHCSHTTAHVLTVKREETRKRRNEEDVSVSVGMGSLRVVTVQRHRHEPTLASKARSTRRALQKPGWRQCASRARRSGVRRPRASLVAGQGRRRRTNTDSFVSSLLRFFVVTVGTFQLDGDRPPTSLFLNSTFCQVLPACPVRNTPRSECAW